MGVRSPGLHFEPYHELKGRPNVVVDGSPADGTVLCLTHWPHIGGPAEHAADLSAEMAFSYADSFNLHADAEIVSNNHFDQDGLVGVFALACPEEAGRRRDLLIDVAACGDFAVYRDRKAARVSMTVSAYADPARSPLSGSVDSDDYDVWCGALYQTSLALVPEWCDHPERSRSLWEEEDACLEASEAALRSGVVKVEEVVDLDLAVVTVSEGAPDSGGHRFGGRWVPGLHPMALCNATERGALLVLRGQRCSFTYRYESWVQFRSRRIRPRVDLAPLAAALDAEEPGGARWVAEPPSALTPTLQPCGSGVSEVSPERVRAMVEDHLRRAPAAWDPYAVTR